MPPIGLQLSIVLDGRLMWRWYSTAVGQLLAKPLLPQRQWRRQAPFVETLTTEAQLLRGLWLANELAIPKGTVVLPAFVEADRCAPLQSKTGLKKLRS